MSDQAEPVARTRKIALEEHFITEDFIPYMRATSGNISTDLFGRAVDRLTEFEGYRIEEMDRYGIDYAVLSLAGPGVQIEPDTQVARRRARAINDVLAEQIHHRPGRFGGFGHVAMQDPRGAADELQRCMEQLQFHGVMINGQTLGHYLDEDQYAVFWERAAAMRAPIYIHPGNPVADHVSYAGHPALVGPTWSWTVETATHALRLVFGGVFDRHPGACVILGHMGETLPYLLWRLDSRFRIAHGAPSLKQKPSDYIRQNIAVTTSGVSSIEPLRCALAALGEDRVMFSIDYPFEHTEEAANWLDTAPLDPAIRGKVAHANAERLLRIIGRGP